MCLKELFFLHNKLARRVVSNSIIFKFPFTPGSDVRPARNEVADLKAMAAEVRQGPWLRGCQG